MTLTHATEPGRAAVDQSAKQNATDFSDEYSNKVNQDYINKVKNKAEEQGLNKDQIKSVVFREGSSLRSQYEETRDANNTQYNSVLHANRVLEASLGKRADEYEENRIGQGKIAKMTGAALGSIPFTNLGSNIGGLNKEQRIIKNLEGTISPLKLKHKKNDN